MKNLLRKIYAKIDSTIVPMAARSKFTAALYYSLFNSQFRREQHATLAGRSFYAQFNESSQIASVILRRNIHRLEKGLCMVPRKPIFALDYIDETLDALSNYLTHPNSIDLNLLTYCHDVLNQYFANTQWPDRASQPQRFRQLKQQILPSLAQVSNSVPGTSVPGTAVPGTAVPCASVTATAAPKPQHEIIKSNISYEQFLLLCQQRCSIRNFLPKPVAKQLIEQVVTAAAQAPSACNRQPFRYIAALEQPLLGQLAHLPMGTAGYAENIPALLAVVGDLSAYPFERDRHVIYIDASLANMQLMLACETLGLASCAINWPDIEIYERKVARLLKLAPHERVVMLIAIGYPEPQALVPHSEKKSAKELIHYG